MDIIGIIFFSIAIIFDLYSKNWSASASDLMVILLFAELHKLKGKMNVL